MQAIARFTTTMCLGLLLLAASHARSQDACNGPYKGKSISPEELADVLAAHRKWLVNEPFGQKANLCGAVLIRANLREANLSQADLKGAALDEADLKGAKLLGADLRRANLSAVLLHKAFLFDTELTKANVSSADVSAVTFEPRSLPDIRSIAFARPLSTMRFEYNPRALHELREAFKKAGLRQQEREVTYAIKHTERHKGWNDRYAGIFQRIESIFNLIFFELTCAYGMAPGRPLLILVGLIPGFAIPYSLALRSRSDAGIWAVWLTDRVHKYPGEEKPVRVTDTHPLPNPWPPGQGWAHLGRLVRAAFIGLYFSLLSAFHIGWRELNVGNWISRLQPREYTLRATGWVRVVSGIQSLLSVYLLALWALTYFGRPFE